MLHLVKGKVGVPEGAGRRTELTIKRRISPSGRPLDLPKAATLGTRLRLLRKRLGVTLDEFSQKTGLSRNAISRAERDAIRQINPRVLQQLLRQLSGRLKEAFPNGDPYDFLIPPLTFGGWLRNQRLRRGMAQKQLAKALRVHVFTVVRYESDRSEPDSSIRQRLRELFGANFEPLLERGTGTRARSSNP
ncbi:MAG: helix-turn-helix transcriptional regulator [Elusimicrobiota bacterium]